MLTLALLLYGINYRNEFSNANTLTLIIGVFVTLFVPKLVFGVFHAADDIFNLALFGYTKISSTPDFSRRNFISQIGAMTSGLMLGSMVYGMLWGKFDFRVIRKDIASTKIPESFDGATIVQISDAHLGSFGDSFAPVRKAVEMINELNPDYVVFTGDMVNNHAKEASPWVDIFKEIKAKGGKFSVFGNHDYADYGSHSPEEKSASVHQLKKIHGQMGFKLLEDEHIELKKNHQSIRLIGVHNWGKGFHQVGDLTKATQGVKSGEFKILLSHDPTHFEEQVKNKTDIDLTLSGHTHGMQMGVEIPSLNIKWSPVRLRYKRWAGLYQDNGQMLYINRGFGVLAYPGRVGMSPEITLLTLRSKA
jgi:predicted MPP superfamily phosphohydrolase